MSPLSFPLCSEMTRDMRVLVRPEERTLLLEPQPRQEELFLLVAVFSAPGNSLARETIRRTWGGQLRSRPGVRLVFVLGTTPGRDVEVNCLVIIVRT